MHTIPLERRIYTFARLGKLLDAYLNKDESGFLAAEERALQKLDQCVQSATDQNPWFIGSFIHMAISNIATMLDEEKLCNWVEQYAYLKHERPARTIGVVMAGNIPMVGFHDLLSVLMSGHQFLGKLSNGDKLLLPAIAELLFAIEPSFSSMATFTENQISGFDAVIATGSNNTARYFEYYFGKYPNIIRRNRNGIAIVNGNETEQDLSGLADDVCTYFGLGCRNVSKLYLPNGFSPAKLMPIFERYNQLMINHSKYFNNYEYNKAMLLVNNEPHFDNGFLILRQSTQLASPVSVMNYEFYGDELALGEILAAQQDNIQCAVSNNGYWPCSIPFGTSQNPSLTDYADGVDTLAWAGTL
jgi:hypothetical protein